MKRNDAPRRRLIAVLFAFAAIANGEMAVADDALAKKSGCYTCHALSERVVGPAFRDVATKYAGKPDAEAQVVRSIREGGSGRWGEIPMPPQKELSEKDSQSLAKWILAGAKK